MAGLGYGDPYGATATAVTAARLRSALLRSATVGGYGGYGYGSPYYGGYGYGSPYYGWYDDYYYPGTGYYVYDSYRRPHAVTTTQRAIGRRARQRCSDARAPAHEASAPNWSGFNRQRHGRPRRAPADADERAAPDTRRNSD